jgi:hypothetical protein
MLLFSETAEAFAERNHPEKAGAYWGGWTAFIGAMAQAGIIVRGDCLQGPHSRHHRSASATGQRQVQDGPFADSKEQLGGYFVIEVPDLDAALAWAARAPVAGYALGRGAPRPAADDAPPREHRTLRAGPPRPRRAAPMAACLPRSPRGRATSPAPRMRWRRLRRRRSAHGRSAACRPRPRRGC